MNLLPIHPRLERAVDGFQKIVAMGLDVEAHQVGAQQAFQQFALPGANAKGLRIRPGNVPEDGHARAGHSLLHHARQQREMIVLHQHHGLFHPLHFLEQRVGELSIHRLVMLPIFGAKDGARMGDVAERPEALVGKAEVVAFLLLFAQPDSLQRVLGLIGRHAQAVPFVHGFAIGVSGAVREPGALAGSQDGFNAP